MAIDPGPASAALAAAPIPAADWLAILPVAMPIAFGAALLVFRERRSQAAAAIAALLFLLAIDIALLARVLAGGPLVMAMGRWPPPFGIAFAADALGALFALVAGFVAVAVALSASRDVEPGRRHGFYPFLLLMMAGVDGAFLTGDMFNLYVWFEVFLIASFGLLILGSDKAQIDGGMKYAVLNLVATTLFLIATACLYGAFGTLNMADIARNAPALRASAPLMTLAVLFLLAFGMKAAAFPVNFWLPASYHTPPAATAALLGGVLTKIGIYALLRTLVMLLPVERAALAGLIGWVSGATILVGALGALAQADIRRTFGFFLISGVGTMLAGIAIGGSAAISGTILYAVHSMLVVSALYLLAGAMRRAAGSFSLHELGGLYGAQPLLAALAFLFMLAASGLPPGLGLWPKVLLVKAALDAGHGWLAFLLLAGGFLTTIALARVFLLAFWRPAPGDAPAQAVAPANMAVLIALAVPMMLFGLYPEPLVVLSQRAAAGLLDASGYIGAVLPPGGGG